MVDDPVPFCGIHHKDGIQGIRHLFLIHLPRLHRRIHERHRLVGRRRRIRAHMGGNKHVALQEVAFVLHIEKLCRNGKGRDGPVAVRHKADLFRSRAESAETA